MKTGNLESIINGNTKYSYIKSFEKNLVRIKFFDEDIKGIVLQHITFGGRSLRLFDIDAKKLAPILHDYLEKHKDDDLKTTLAGYPNMTLISEVFSSDIVKFINNECGTHYGNSFQMGFVGDKLVHTVFMLSQFRRPIIWEVSPAISAVLLAMRAIFSSAMRVHPKFTEQMDKLLTTTTFDMAKKTPNFKFPNVAALFRYISDCKPEVHQFLLHILERYPLENRQEWLHNISVVMRKCTVLKESLSLAWSGIAITMLDKLSEDEIEMAAKRTLSFLNTHHFNEFAAELVDRGITKFSGIKLIKRIIVQMAMDNADDSEKLYFLLKKATVQYLEVVAEFSKRPKRMEVFKQLISPLTKFICDLGRTPDTLNMITAMTGAVNSSTKNIIRDQMNILDQSLPWLSYRMQAHCLVYASDKGSIFISKYTTTVIRTILSLTKESIDYVSFDNTGKYVYAFCKASGTLLVVTISGETSIVIDGVNNYHFDPESTFSFSQEGEFVVKEPSGKSTPIKSNKSKNVKEPAGKKSKH